jgi:hypothetical protein
MAYFSRSPECTKGGINAVFEKKKQQAQVKILEAEDTERPGHDTVRFTLSKKLNLNRART